MICNLIPSQTKRLIILLTFADKVIEGLAEVAEYLGEISGAPVHGS